MLDVISATLSGTVFILHECLKREKNKAKREFGSLFLFI